jgi:hypothetical protein
VPVAKIRLVADGQCNHDRRPAAGGADAAAGAHATAVFRALYGSPPPSSRAGAGGHPAGPRPGVEVQLRAWGKAHRAEVLRVAPEDPPASPGEDSSPATAASPGGGSIDGSDGGAAVAVALFPQPPPVQAKRSGGNGGHHDENDAAAGGQRPDLELSPPATGASRSSAAFARTAARPPTRRGAKAQAVAARW